MTTYSRFPKYCLIIKKCPHQAITYDFQFFGLTSLSVLCCNVRVSILDVADGKTAIFLGLPFASNGNGQTAINVLIFDPKWPKFTMFVFEFFFAKINFLAKARLEPVNTRVSTVGRLNHSSTELVKK